MRRSTGKGSTVSSQMPSARKGSMPQAILASSRQLMYLKLSTASMPHAKKPMAFRTATELESPITCVPTGIAKMFPANPVTACIV